MAWFSVRYEPFVGVFQRPFFFDGSEDQFGIIREPVTQSHPEVSHRGNFRCTRS